MRRTKMGQEIIKGLREAVADAVSSKNRPKPSPIAGKIGLRGPGRALSRRKPASWDFQVYLDRMEGYRKGADGAHEWAIDALNKRGGYDWQHSLSQTDLIGTVVEAVRAHDRRPKRRR